GPDFLAKSGTLLFAPSTPEIITRQSVSTPPRLAITRDVSRFILRWPVTDDRFDVQYTDALGSGAVWKSLDNAVQQVGSEYNTMDCFRGHARFYRLKSRDTARVIFKPGDTDVTIEIAVNPDSRAHPTRNFFVNLSNPVNALIADNQGKATILNEISPPEI